MLPQNWGLGASKPASEYIDGEVIQKRMPKGGKHSQLRLRLCNSINDYAEGQQIAYAFPELRCSYPSGSCSSNIYGARSAVPDVAVFQWGRIPFDGDGEVPNDFLLVPDWTIEILSPEQSSNRVIGNILYCLQEGCQLGWLIDPSDRSILVFRPEVQPQLLRGSDRLTVLDEIQLELTVEGVFGWLKMLGG